MNSIYRTPIKKRSFNVQRKVRPSNLPPAPFAHQWVENIIAALTTGSGKTLISILLIKWIASQSTSSGKSIVFLVPRVTLVDQQQGVIQRHTSLKVAKLHGAMEIALNNRPAWKKKLESHDVFVMTRS